MQPKIQLDPPCDPTAPTTEESAAVAMPGGDSRPVLHPLGVDLASLRGETEVRGRRLRETLRPVLEEFISRLH
jgi:hypothetical protein